MPEERLNSKTRPPGGLSRSARMISDEHAVCARARASERALSKHPLHGRGKVWPPVGCNVASTGKLSRYFAQRHALVAQLVRQGDNLGSCLGVALATSALLAGRDLPLSCGPEHGHE
jgi:hypothetical protein